METLEMITKVLGIVTTAFSVLASLYAFFKWLRKKSKAVDAPVTVQVTKRIPVLKPAPEPASSSPWPWLVASALLFLWLSFIGVFGVTWAFAQGITPVDPTPMHFGKESYTPPVTVDLTGSWVEPDGNAVTITHDGDRITMRMPMLNALGLDSSVTTLHGSIEESTDRRYAATVNVSNAAMTARFNVTADGRRMEGTVNNGFEALPSVLLRK
jgi:hypothetical protein